MKVPVKYIIVDRAQSSPMVSVGYEPANALIQAMIWQAHPAGKGKIKITIIFDDETLLSLAGELDEWEKRGDLIDLRSYVRATEDHFNGNSDVRGGI